ncbi:protein RADIALIS-like 3 [Lolium rigidum]|uniref:protein RADIALIS-like 3 n=1 Tax=Lolium rigidum TaxID=89674 RepID=UPI001F5C6EB3|nr:protein RADIALIS-like 3 [Lolium rigidum]
MEWSTAENDRFERALATYGGDSSGVWERVAAAVGGGKTADDVRRHYALLTEDLGDIERGRYGYPTGTGANNANHRNNGRNSSLSFVPSRAEPIGPRHDGAMGFTE